MEAFNSAVKISYDCAKNEWNEESVEVTITTEPFAKGAMRSAYKMMLKDSEGIVKPWVAKLYHAPLENDLSTEDAFKNDVILQSYATHYAELFNSSKPSPPKKVHMVPAYLLKIDGQSDNLYCIEPFIEGNYAKFNANNGTILRESEWHNTPHAFSHFTFEKSNHDLIVVDIQGVGEMYTDPQIHTCERGHNISKFGVGNLGVRGMALFLYTHQCNPVCQYLNLKEFTLYEDMFSNKPDVGLWRETTVVSLHKMNSSLPNILTNSRRIGLPPKRKGLNESKDQLRESNLRNSNLIATNSFGCPRPNLKNSGKVLTDQDEYNVIGLRHSPKQARLASSKPPEDLPWPADIIPEVSTMAYVHFYLAQLHKVGRLAQIDELNRSEAAKAGLIQSNDVFESTPDIPAAFYHYQKAAFLGSIEACLILARIYGPNQDVLAGMVDMSNDERRVKFLKIASEKGSKEATYWLAKFYETGESCEKDLVQAYKYYSRLLDPEVLWTITEPDELFEWNITAPSWEIKASLAQLLIDEIEGIEMNHERAGGLLNEAAEEATDAGKGKLAMKYFEMIEYLDY